MWMLLVLFYGLMKGAREIVKKLALKKSTSTEVLVVYTGIAFLMVTPQWKGAMGLDPHFFPYIILKSFVIFVAWRCSFIAISKLPLSLYGVLDLSRVLFATLLGVTVLGEVMGAGQYIGLFFVCAGLIMLRYRPTPILRLLALLGNKGAVAPTTSSIENHNNHATTSSHESKDIQNKSSSGYVSEDVKIVYVICAFASCMLNAFSGLLDKILMKDLSSSQLQFWYMMFLFGFYILYIIVTKTKIPLSVLKNGWIWLLSLMFVLADKALFIANSSGDSKITVMTLIKQSACIVTILGGKLVFKEKNIAYKLFCAIIIVAGIVFGIMGI